MRNIACAIVLAAMTLSPDQHFHDEGARMFAGFIILLLFLGVFLPSGGSK